MENRSCAVEVGRLPVRPSVWSQGNTVVVNDERRQKGLVDGSDGDQATEVPVDHFAAAERWSEQQEKRGKVDDRRGLARGECRKSTPRAKARPTPQAPKKQKQQKNKKCQQSAEQREVCELDEPVLAGRQGGSRIQALKR